MYIHIYTYPQRGRPSRHGGQRAKGGAGRSQQSGWRWPLRYLSLPLSLYIYIERET